MSRRNNDAITIHSILSWIEDNLESPLSLEKVSERSGYSKWHLQRMFKKETGHSLGQYGRALVNLKCDPQKSLLHQTIYRSIEPGYHMNKKHWITVVPGEDISVDLLAELIDDSWNLIVDKLSKKEQQRLRPG